MKKSRAGWGVPLPWILWSKINLVVAMSRWELQKKHYRTIERLCLQWASFLSSSWKLLPSDNETSGHNELTWYSRKLCLSKGEPTGQLLLLIGGIHGEEVNVLWNINTWNWLVSTCLHRKKFAFIAERCERGPAWGSFCSSCEKTEQSTFTCWKCKNEQQKCSP